MADGDDAPKGVFARLGFVRIARARVSVGTRRA
jgi:hypothetical protein